MTATPDQIKRNLILFTIVVLLSGWVGQLINRWMESPSEESPGMLIWLVAPLFATLALRAFGGDGWRDMGLRPLFQGNVRWYVFSILIFPVLTILTILLGKALGWIRLENLDYQVYFNAFILALIPNFIKNIPEEFVWRGYLTPKLASLKIHDYYIYLIVGLIWGVWHLPYYLYFLDAETISEFTAMHLWTFIPVSILTMIAWSVVFVEIWFLTKSIWPAVLMHMMEDSFINPLILDANFQIIPGKDIWVHPVAGIISIMLYTVVGLGLRKVRRNDNLAI